MVASARYDTERQRVTEIMDRLTREFDLGWLSINNLFVESVREDAIVATTEGEWEYRYANIEWNLPAVARLTDPTLEDVAVHELVHCVLLPMEQMLPKKDHARQHAEYAVESLCRMIQASRRNNA